MFNFFDRPMLSLPFRVSVDRMPSFFLRIFITEHLDKCVVENWLTCKISILQNSFCNHLSSYTRLQFHLWDAELCRTPSVRIWYQHLSGAWLSINLVSNCWMLWLFKGLQMLSYVQTHATFQICCVLYLCLIQRLQQKQLISSQPLVKSNQSLLHVTQRQPQPKVHLNNSLKYLNLTRIQKYLQQHRGDCISSN